MSPTFSETRLRVKMWSLTLGHELLQEAECVQCQKYLGKIIDSKLTFKANSEADVFPQIWILNQFYCFPLASRKLSWTLFWSLLRKNSFSSRTSEIQTTTMNRNRNKNTLKLWVGDPGTTTQFIHFIHSSIHALPLPLFRVAGGGGGPIPAVMGQRPVQVTSLSQSSTKDTVYHFLKSYLRENSQISWTSSITRNPPTFWHELWPSLRQVSRQLVFCCLTIWNVSVWR